MQLAAGCLYSCIDAYKTIRAEAYGLFKEKGSKFHAYAFPASSPEEAQAHLDRLKKQYYDARHVAYAWRFGPQGQSTKAHDAGEPAHSAGDPILNELRSQEVTECLVVVIRYFGGTKLGIGGLIEAYKLSARAALAAAEIYEFVLTEPISIRFPYDRTSEVNQLMHHMQLKPVKSDFAADCQHHFEIRQSEAEAVREAFRKLRVLEEEAE